jgi:putative aldouronate transport system permease protein
MIENKTSKIVTPLIVNAVFILTTIICILPILLLVSISFSDTDNVFKLGYSFIPRGFTFAAYEFIFKDGKQILNSYQVTTIVAFMGGAISLILISLLAYPLSRADYKYKNRVSFVVFFTMLFNGGLVPWYILISRYLHLTDTIWVLILPYLIVPWYVILLRTFFSNIPLEIMEAASIDGSSEINTFIKIVLPMSKPALATVGLFILLRYWNDWWLGMLFIQKDTLIPLQYLLYRILSNIEELQKNMMFFEATATFPEEPARMAMAVIVAGPMLFILPFFQKYFVAGLTVGAVKG